MYQDVIYVRILKKTLSLCLNWNMHDLTTQWLLLHIQFSMVQHHHQAVINTYLYLKPLWSWSTKHELNVLNIEAAMMHSLTHTHTHTYHNYIIFMWECIQFIVPSRHFFPHFLLFLLNVWSLLCLSLVILISTNVLLYTF